MGTILTAIMVGMIGATLTITIMVGETIMLIITRKVETSKAMTI